MARSAYFNPRPREEGDSDFNYYGESLYNFNPRPREEGDVSCGIMSFSRRYFNPRPREEGDIKYSEPTIRKSISIHALVKRATEGKKKNAYGWIISIHALVKRAT